MNSLNILPWKGKTIYVVCDLFPYHYELSRSRRAQAKWLTGVKIVTWWSDSPVRSGFWRAGRLLVVLDRDRGHINVPSYGRPFLIWAAFSDPDEVTTIDRSNTEDDLLDSFVNTRLEGEWAIRHVCLTFVLPSSEAAERAFLLQRKSIFFSFVSYNTRLSTVLYETIVSGIELENEKNKTKNKRW